MLSYWTMDRLESFKDEPETILLEFKESRLLLTDSGDIDRERIGSKLSVEVSAFANTEGGTIIVGMTERKEKGKKTPGVATGLDEGVEVTKVGRDQLQRILESNVAPYLPGLRVHAVLSRLVGRQFFVIEVPKGDTAYQANDGLYYGRSEIGVHALKDHDIRVRMVRSQTAAARLEASQVSVSLGFEPKALSEIGHPGDRGNAPKEGLKYRFELRITNCGPLTIKDFLLCIDARGEYSERFYKTGSWRLSKEKAWQVEDENCDAEFKIFPGETMVFPGEALEFWLERDAECLELYKAQIRWTIYLDNSPPSTGVIDLAEILQAKPGWNPMTLCPTCGKIFQTDKSGCGNCGYQH